MINIKFTVNVSIITILCVLYLITNVDSQTVNKVAVDPGDSTVIANTWYDEWDEGMSAAQREHKPVLVDFYSDGCGACAAMHKKTFTAPEITRRLAADWISIRINTGKPRFGTYDGRKMNYFELSRYFRVLGVPTFVFFDRDRKPVQSVIGYKDREIFGLILDYMRDEAYTKGITFKEYRNSGKKQ